MLFVAYVVLITGCRAEFLQYRIISPAKMAVQNDVDELIKYYSALESVGESVLANKQQVAYLALFRPNKIEIIK